MPNHIDMIIILKDGTPECASPTKAIIPKIINAFKSLTARCCGKPIWQRSYHDHIIRNEDAYIRISKYIDESPAKWAKDEYYYQ